MRKQQSRNSLLTLSPGNANFTLRRKHLNSVYMSLVAQRCVKNYHILSTRLRSLINAGACSRSHEFSTRQVSRVVGGHRIYYAFGGGICPGDDKAAKNAATSLPRSSRATFDNFRRRRRTIERCRSGDSRAHGNMTYGFNVSLLSRTAGRAAG